MARKLTAIDLFAGGGGLTVGLKAAGFRVQAAVEIEKNAFDTYVANHSDVHSFQEDIVNVTGAQLTAKARRRQIDLISGCPPCQGFTSLTAKYRKRDRRNSLVEEMTRIIDELRPRAVMMENVPGLAMRGKWRLKRFLRDLRRMGYFPTADVLQVADYGVPQFRRRLVVLAGLGFEIPMPKPTHSRNGIGGLRQWNTVRSAIERMGRPVRFSALGQRKLSPESVNWHVVRAISPENEARLRAAKPGAPWWTIPVSLRPNCHRGKYRGFRNVYGRMRWNDVSPTITGGCTSLSKGRFGHPRANRTISVREAAILQTFPRGYCLKTTRIDQACNIVGNALPCRFAAALAKQCHAYIVKAERQQRKNRDRRK